jgi:hypothetical protein
MGEAEAAGAPRGPPSDFPLSCLAHIAALEAALPILSGEGLAAAEEVLQILSGYRDEARADLEAWKSEEEARRVPFISAQQAPTHREALEAGVLVSPRPRPHPQRGALGQKMRPFATTPTRPSAGKPRPLSTLAHLGARGWQEQVNDNVTTRGMRERAHLPHSTVRGNIGTCSEGCGGAIVNNRC